MPSYDITASDNGGWLAAVGAADVPTALADASDSSYAKQTSSVWGARCTMTDPSSPTGRLASIGLFVRSKKAGSLPATVTIGRMADMDGNPANGKEAVVRGGAITIPVSGSFADSEILAAVGQDPDSAAFNVAPADPLANDLVLYVTDANTVDANRAQIAKAHMHLYYLGAVTCSTPSAPTGTVTSTQRPTLTVPLSLVVEAWQLVADYGNFLCGGDVEFQVFRSADAPDGSPPVGVTPIWSGTVRYLEATAGTRTPSVSATCGAYLDNDTYVVYARASRDLMSGAQLYWSAWAKSADWTQDIALPNAPTVGLTADSTNQRVAIVITEDATSGYDSSTAVLELQRLVDGAWRDVRDLTDIALTVGSAQAIGSDYECDRAATNTYRARVTMWHTADAVTRASEWTQQTVTGPTVSGWNLKAVDDSTANWIAAPVATQPSEDSQAKTGLFEILDRPLPVVVSGVLSGMSGSFEITASGSTQITTLEALRDYAGLVLLETAFGDVKYVRLTKVSWVRLGTAAAPRRHAQLSYVEVGCDLPEDDS